MLDVDGEELGEDVDAAANQSSGAPLSGCFPGCHIHRLTLGLMLIYSQIYLLLVIGQETNMATNLVTMVGVRHEKKKLLHKPSLD